MRITLFGATGLVGNALMRESPSDSIAGLSSKDADIRKPQAIAQALAGTRPDWIILAAAYTDVDECESNRDLAFAVNRDGAINIARAAKKIHARLLFLSTDYVFDGSKTTPYETSDKRAPQTIYGKTKAEAEVRLIDIAQAAVGQRLEQARHHLLMRHPQQGADVRRVFDAWNFLKPAA